MVIEVYLLWIADIKARKAWIVTPALDSHISTYYCSVLSCVLLFATPWTVALSSIISQSLLWEFAPTHVYWVGDVMQPFHSLLPPSPPAINLSQHQVFSHELALWIRWPKYLSFSFSISPSNEYSGLIFFRINWFDLLAVQGTLKSLLQHHNLKESIHWHSDFFMVQLSTSIHDYWKNHSFDYMDLCRQSDVSAL